MLQDDVLPAITTRSSSIRREKRVPHSLKPPLFIHADEPSSSYVPQVEQSECDGEEMDSNSDAHHAVGELAESGYRFVSSQMGT